jgi:protein-S-isoprenylcysteine O-methyltransferase Ste14
MIAAVTALILMIQTVSLFFSKGKGTPAPWDPPKKLVVRGPYRNVRNPMITGVLVFLLAEAMFFRSWPIAVWMFLFFMGNSVYFPLIEEKGLEKRFGDAYVVYCQNVPRWIPRLKPWRPDSINRDQTERNR